ncbi:MAG: hypothetical protein ACK4NC_07135 [Candidatus Gracilibacteria bacterium]
MTPAQAAKSIDNLLSMNTSTKSPQKNIPLAVSLSATKTISPQFDIELLRNELISNFSLRATEITSHRSRHAEGFKSDVLSKVHEVIAAPQIDIERISDKYFLETKSLDQITVKDMNELIENYREDFGSQPWGEYKKCGDPSCLFKVSVEEYYGTKGVDVPLKELEAHGNKADDCPECPAHKDTHELVDYISKEDLRKSLEGKFKHEGQITLLRTNGAELVGYTWGYKSSFREALAHEFKLHSEDPDLMFKYITRSSTVLGKEFNLDSSVYVWNMLGISKAHRKSFDNFVHICRKILSSVPEKFAHLPMPGECNRGIDFYNTLKAAGASDICESLYEGYVMILLGKQVKDLQNFFCKTPENYMQENGPLYKTYKKMQKQSWRAVGGESPEEVAVLDTIGYKQPIAVAR